MRWQFFESWSPISISHTTKAFRATRTFALLGRSGGGGEYPLRPGVSVDPPGDDDAVVVVRDDLVRVDEDVGDGGRVLVQHPRSAVDDESIISRSHWVTFHNLNVRG